jgi:hypothetical protein
MLNAPPLWKRVEIGFENTVTRRTASKEKNHELSGEVSLDWRKTRGEFTEISQWYQILWLHRASADPSVGPPVTLNFQWQPESKQVIVVPSLLRSQSTVWNFTSRYDFDQSEGIIHSDPKLRTICKAIWRKLLAFHDSGQRRLKLRPHPIWVFYFLWNLPICDFAATNLLRDRE